MWFSRLIQSFHVLERPTIAFELGVRLITNTGIVSYYFKDDMGSRGISGAAMMPYNFPTTCALTF